MGFLSDQSLHLACGLCVSFASKDMMYTRTSQNYSLCIASSQHAVCVTLINTLFTFLIYCYKPVSRLKSVRWPLQQSSCPVPHHWMIFVTSACSCPSVSISRVSVLVPPPLVMRKVHPSLSLLRSTFFDCSFLFKQQWQKAKGLTISLSVSVNVAVYWRDTSAGMPTLPYYLAKFLADVPRMIVAGK